MMLMLLSLLLSCEHLLRPSPEAARAWHSAQWAALAQACLADSVQLALPDAPQQPWGLGPAVPAAYQELLNCAVRERAAWATLEQDSREQLRYCSQLLEALYQRDSTQISSLSSELDSRRTQQASVLADYSAALEQRRAALEALRRAWQERWPEQDLDFDLDRALESARAEHNALDTARREQLRAYHGHHYARLTRRYLGWAGSGPTPAANEAASATAAEDAAAPGGSSELRSALQALEAALVARNALETQVAVDAGVLQRYARGEGISATRRQYREPRLAVAQARLALFSRIDALLSPAEDVLQTQVTRQWLALWPDCDVETNIYAWAGLPERVKTAAP